MMLVKHALDQHLSENLSPLEIESSSHGASHENRSYSNLPFYRQIQIEDRRHRQDQYVEITYHPKYPRWIVHMNRESTSCRLGCL
jgi:hypothetical protein